MVSWSILCQGFGVGVSFPQAVDLIAEKHFLQLSLVILSFLLQLLLHFISQCECWMPRGVGL